MHAPRFMEIGKAASIDYFSLDPESYDGTDGHQNYLIKTLQLLIDLHRNFHAT